MSNNDTNMLSYTASSLYFSSGSKVCTFSSEGYSTLDSSKTFSAYSPDFNSSDISVTLLVFC